MYLTEPLNLEDNNRQLTTHNIKQLGFSSLQAFVPASTFPSVDRNAARKPNRFILSNVCVLNRTIRTSSLGAVQKMEDFYEPM